MSSAVKNLIVFGGNGFLGKRICQAGVNRGYNVTSVSSSGSLPKKLESNDSQWVNKVNWSKGDIFQPSSYKEKLPEATAVVHSLGILLENQNYKKVVNSNDDLLQEIQSFFKTANPMKKTVFNTYEKMNTESALVLGETLTEVNKQSPAFVYISADRGFPGLPSGYIDSKRKAEYELYQMQPDLRPILMRPGFMYDESVRNGDARSKFKSVLQLANKANSFLLRNALDGFVRPPISTQLVAEWCIDKIEDPEFHGPVLLDEMVNVKRR